MKVQLINNISLDLISGGNVYNKAIINGLSENGIVVAYNSSPLNQDYDITIVDSLCMNEIEINKFNINKPFVALIHQLPELDRNVLNFYKMHSKFLVTGEPTKDALIKTWSINEDQITIIRPGVPESWQAKTEFKEKPKQIIIVSNFIQNKGYELLIQLLNDLEPLDIKIDIIGNNELDKVYAEKIISTIKQTDAAVSFHFNLNRIDLYDRLVNADLFLSLSKSESFGMAIFEALSIGLPCITYKTGDYKYFEHYSNFVGIDHYAVSNFSEIIEDWVQNPKTYKAHCNQKTQIIRPWNQVVDEFSSYLKNNVKC